MGVPLRPCFGWVVMLPAWEGYFIKKLASENGRVNEPLHVSLISNYSFAGAFL